MTSASRESTSKITIVGSGLVGSLWAVFLARRGFEIEMFERRVDMRSSSVSAGRSINLAVSLRGISALQEAGVGTEVLSQAIPMRGRMMHAVDGTLTFQRYGKDDSEYINSISRGALNQALMTAAERAGRVRIEFEKRVTGVDLRNRTLVLKDERAGRTESRPFQTVFGTDGSASALREAILAEAGAPADENLLDYGYKELTIPAGAGQGDRRFRMEKHALHIWPRGSYMLIALPNFDGSFTCTLFLPFKGAVSFETLRRREDVARFFREAFPDAAPLIPDLEDTFSANPTGQMVTVKCAPWNAGGRALLLGDAAHAIVPFFGQGMNAGFEDLSILDRSLGQALGASSGAALAEAALPEPTLAETEWERLFDSFWRARKPDADAIADLAVENFVEMRDRVADPAFLFERKVEAVLQKEFPGEYLSRYSMVTFSRMPYYFALEAGRVHAAILGELCRGVTDPARIDLAKARTLIREKLTPIMDRAKTQQLIS